MSRKAFSVLLLVLFACTDATQVNPGSPAPASEPAGQSPPSPSDVERLTCWEAESGEGEAGLVFEDVTEAAGLVDLLLGMRGHAAAWGDVNRDGRADLFVGTFANRPEESYRVRGAGGPAPDRLLLAGPSGLGFALDPHFPDQFGRTSGAVFADLDGDGDLDLVASRNPREGERASLRTALFRNEAGALHLVEASGIPDHLVGRSVGVLDFDRDGLLDLFVAEDRFRGGSSVLLRNIGDLRFEEATEAAGLPSDVHGLGVGTADLNGDGHTDLFVAGSNRLFVGGGDGTFREAPNQVFQWEVFGDEDDVSGVSIADVNRDGWPDLVLGHHYNSTVDGGQRVPIRLYLNRGPDGQGDPAFEDVTEEAGLVPLPTKAPHVELNDFDNDGWPDILATASAHGGASPAIFRHAGLEAGVPHFEPPGGLGDPQYWVTGPSADVDQDGRLDVLLVEWEPTLPSRLLRNRSGTGNWLSVEVTGPGGGIGTKVAVYAPGGLGEPGALLGLREIVVSQGYSAGHQARAHFGLADLPAVDVRLTRPDGQVFDLEGVPANRHLALPDGCADA
ncbi:MAG: CRTAC1 family protein [Acidimicrobiia bacterium]